MYNVCIIYILNRYILSRSSYGNYETIKNFLIKPFITNFINIFNDSLCDVLELNYII